MITFNVDNINNFKSFNVVIFENILPENVIKGKAYLTYLETKLNNSNSIPNLEYPHGVMLTIFLKNHISIIGIINNEKQFIKSTVLYLTDDGNQGIIYDDLLFHNNTLYIFELNESRKNFIRSIKIESLNG